jgi:hypothetical protein
MVKTPQLTPSFCFGEARYTGLKTILEPVIFVSANLIILFLTEESKDSIDGAMESIRKIVSCSTDMNEYTQ